MGTQIKVKVGIIGGSGLDVPEILNNRTERILPTVYGMPSGALIEGDIQGIPCVLVARHGKAHTIMPGNVNYRANIWAMKELGCTHLIVTTATGSLQEDIEPGDIVIPHTFIDRTTKRIQTFHDGQPNSPAGVCHLPLEPAFCERTRQILVRTAKELGLEVHKSGVIVTIEGPRFSSKAESNMFRMWGGSLVNMTTVPEVVLAKEAGLCYAVIAVATDYDCWRDTGNKVCVPDVLAMFKKNIAKVVKLIVNAVPEIANEKWDNTIRELQAVVQDSIV